MKKMYPLLSLGIAGCLYFAGGPIAGAAGAFNSMTALQADLTAASPETSISSAANGSSSVTSSAIAPHAAVGVTDKTMEEKEAAYEAKLTLPVLSGLADSKYAAELNDIIERHAMKDLASLKEEAAKNAEAAEQAGYELRPYQLFVSYELKSDGSEQNSGIVSLVVRTEVSWGNNFMPRVDTYNFSNTADPRHIGLQDLFGDEHQSFLYNEVTKQMKAQPDLYWADEFKGIGAEQSFYVQHGEAVIVFGKYEVAPGYLGTPEFRIPLPAAAGVSGRGTAVQPDSRPQPIPGQAVKLRINNELLEKQGYVNDAGASLIPLRAVAEALGYTLSWDTGKRQAELQRGDERTVVQVGQDRYSYAQTAPFALGTAPVIRDDSLYVPLDFAVKVLQAEVNERDGAVTIQTHEAAS